MYKRKAGILILMIMTVVLLFGCGKKQKENVTKETTEETTEVETTMEEIVEQETFRYSITYTAVLDTSELTDEETSDAIKYLREEAAQNHMQIGLGQASYNELVLIITCYYNKDEVTTKDVREKLLSGLEIKSIQ